MTADITNSVSDVNQEFLSVSDYRPTTNTSNSSQLPSIADAVKANLTTHAHPQAAGFSIIFKAISIFLYIFGSFFTTNFVLVFVLVIISVAADFWTVKNVTGRMLVGLRWWNEVREDGSSEWQFESRNTDSINNKDSRLFWITLYLTPVIWFFLLVSAVVKFNLKWLPITLVGIVLNCAQLWGYWKCQRDAKRKLQNFISQGVNSIGVGIVQAQLKQMQKQ